MMMSPVCVLAVLVAMTTTVWSQTTSCLPGQNCNAPNCRCWNDGRTPGDIAIEDTPQIILFTFEYALNSANAGFYRSLFETSPGIPLLNPNNCSAVGTFFVQKTSTDLSICKELSDAGHEIGVTTIDGTAPNSAQAWHNNFVQVKNTLAGAGIQASKVLGVRAPELRPGGNDELLAMAQEGFLYDASCTTSSFVDQANMIWPYTYDFAPGPACDNGAGPELPFPGKWQILMADLEFNNTRCSTPSACTAVATQQDAFDLFYNNFIRHYEGNRSPFIVAINPDWVATDYKRAGTAQFLQYVRAALAENVWILTATQLLEWIRNPMTNQQAKDNNFPPWTCP